MRQAVVVVAREATAPELARLAAVAGANVADELLRACLLDLIGSLVRLDGATLSVLCAGRAHGRRVADALPAGIDVFHGEAAGAGDGSGHPLESALRHHLERGFARVVALSGDAIGVPSRTVATALGALAEADGALGPTPSGGLYLLAVRGAEGLALVGPPGAGPLPTAGEVDARGTLGGLTLRRMEPRPRLAEFASPTSLRDGLRRRPDVGPRLGEVARLAG